jgi:hypothetical protein
MWPIGEPKKKKKSPKNIHLITSKEPFKTNSQKNVWMFFNIREECFLIFFFPYGHIFNDVQQWQLFLFPD